MLRTLLFVATSTSILAISQAALAQQGQQGKQQCSTLPGWSTLKNALASSITASGKNGGANGGLGFNMWATLVANDGTVCAVAFSGTSYMGQWLGSRVISAQKANTANDFSLGHNSTPNQSAFPNGLALSTANLYSAVQPGGSLYGLQHSNPVDTGVAYTNNGNGSSANASSFGTSNDPMVGLRIGGVNVFGGGLALYSGGVKVGGVGVSGDTSCTDHMVAWRVRNALGLDQFNGGNGPVGGVSDAAHPDNIIFDIPDGGTSTGGFGHPKCLYNPDPSVLPGVK
jgi:uncharacterized protein GlcG (DUF336 family)